MTNVMGSRFGDSMISAAGAGATVCAIVAIDDRIQTFLARLLTSDHASDIAVASARVQRGWRIAMDTAGGDGERLALVLFLLGGIFLASLMFRA